MQNYHTHWVANEKLLFIYALQERDYGLSEEPYQE